MTIEREHQLIFGPFHLDPIQKRLYRGNQEIALQARPLAVLLYLITHHGRVISKEELLKHVWAGIYVTKSSLQVCIRAIRDALGDEAGAPRYLETVGREGYRWIGEVESPQPKVQSREFPIPNRQSAIVGREKELTQLHAWLDMAREGRRQVVFIAGEPGIGKTTVVDVFLERIQTEGVLRIGRGQCMEQYGEGEAYLPVLEALTQVCRAPDGQYVIDLLSRYAPTWLVQMPALVEESALAGVQQRVVGVTRERMLREMADALAALTAERGLVLVCEDLHASDRSTVELIAYLAQRRELARLLIIGTYRPATAVAKGHPLSEGVRTLRVHGQCHELRLELLNEADVVEYFTRRLLSPSPSSLPTLQVVAQQVHTHTEGNPLFLVSMVTYLLQQRLLHQVDGQWQLARSLKEVGIPENVQQMIAQQVERLTSEEQRLLEAASIQGYEFDAAVVAQALVIDVTEVEERLAVLERVYGVVRFMAEEEFPDRTLRLSYRFVHVLYQNALYNALTPTRKAQLSNAVAQALVRYYGEQNGATAVALAHLYKTAREFARAAGYYGLAAQHAMQVFAYAEAVSLARQGLELITAVPDSPHRQQHELGLQLALGGALTASQGYSAPEVGVIYTRACKLGEQTGDSQQLLFALSGLAGVHLTRGELAIALKLGEQILRIAQRLQDPVVLVSGHLSVGSPLLFLGEFGAARAHFEQGLAVYNPQESQTLAQRDGRDTGMVCRCLRASALWHLGYAEQALHRIREALTAAQETPSLTFNLVTALNMVGWIHLHRREAAAVQTWAEEMITFATEQGFAHAISNGLIERGWALVEQGQGKEGITQLRQGITAYQPMGEVAKAFYLSLLAEAYGKEGQPAEGLTAVAEGLALVDKTSDRQAEAELWRVKGDLTLQQFQVSGCELQVPGTKSKIKSPQSKVSNPQSAIRNPQSEEAEACFLKAIEVARRQQAKFWELRAVMSLGRLWQSQGKKKEAHKLLAEVYEWFTEGFDTVDLKEAKTLLEELGH